MLAQPLEYDGYWRTTPIASWQMDVSTMNPAAQATGAEVMDLITRLSSCRGEKCSHAA